MQQRKFESNRVRILALLLCVMGLAGLSFGLATLDLSRSAPSAKTQNFILEVPFHREKDIETYKTWFRLTEDPTFVPRPMRTG